MVEGIPVLAAVLADYGLESWTKTVHSVKEMDVFDAGMMLCQNFYPLALVASREIRRLVWGFGASIQWIVR